MSKTFESQVAKAKQKKALEAKDVAEAFKRSGSGINKGVMIPVGDVHRHPNQNYQVLSYCTSDGATRVKSVKDLAMKFGPCFETEPEARKWAQLIASEDPRFDVKVVSLYEWGTVPLPDEQRPFVESVYANEILTRAVGGLQRSMIRGKQEVEERKSRELAAAERAMQKVRGKDYKMPEKSKDILDLEEKIKKEREAASAALITESAAVDIVGSGEVKFSIGEISELVMIFCKEHDGEPLDTMTAALLSKHIARKSIEIEAEIRRARASEFKDEDPRNVPTPHEIQVARDEEAKLAIESLDAKDIAPSQ